MIASLLFRCRDAFDGRRGGAAVRLADRDELTVSSIAPDLTRVSALAHWRWSAGR